MGCQGFEILGVRSDDGPAWFSRGDHERVNSRATTGKSAQKRSATRKRFRNARRDVTGLQELVLDGVATGMTLETLNENDRRDLWRPQPRFAQGEDQSQSLLGTFSEASNAARVEDQHVSYPVLRGRR